MEQIFWYTWIIIAIVLLIVEIFIPTFFAVCLAIGCLIAGVFSFLDFDLKIQLLVFSIGTVISIFSVRPFMLRYAHRNSRKIITNAEALIGKTGIVSVSVDNSLNQGRIMVEGEDWKASALDDEIINEGERVTVTGINSTILIVKRINK